MISSDPVDFDKISNLNYVWKEIKASFLTALWFCLLTFPLVVIKVDSIEKTAIFQWINLIYVAIGAFVASWLWRFALERREKKVLPSVHTWFAHWYYAAWRIPLFLFVVVFIVRYVYLSQFSSEVLRYICIISSVGIVFLILHMCFVLYEKFKTRPKLSLEEHLSEPKTWIDAWFCSKWKKPGIALILILLFIFPFKFSSYQVSIMITAMLYITLGLGLNIVVGVSGLLNLGYVAFYGIGAYTYALLFHYFGFSFWLCLPISALISTIFGLALGFPVLRLRGDYLAIVTLGFGEIFRLVLENWDTLTLGPSGVKHIPRPDMLHLAKGYVPQSVGDYLHHITFSPPHGLASGMTYIYYIAILLVIITIIAVYRLENSRLGRAWLALREDEVAGQATGIDIAKAKLTAFAFGATWAGLAGALFASKTGFINPSSFSFLESAMILSIVVLGGMGSIPGVIIGAMILILLPEYLRAFSEYRMLLFGALMVLMMVFRPGGLIQSVRQTYKYTKKPDENIVNGDTN